MKKVKKSDKSERYLNSFGNKKSVFWSITFAIIILTIISFPTILSNQQVLASLLIIWILEIIYIWMYVSIRWNNKKKAFK